MSEELALLDDWACYSIKEIALVKGGKRLPAGEEFANEVTPFPYIRVTDMDNASVDESNLVYVKPEIEPVIKNYKISKNDIYVSIAGTLGLFGRIPDSLDQAQLTENAAKLSTIDRKRFDLDLLTYILNSDLTQDQINREIGAGAGVPKLALHRIEGLKVNLPTEIEQQKKIANILSTADKLIENTQTLIDKYTTIKQGMMADLFTRGIELSPGPDGTPASNPNYGQLRPSFDTAPELYQQTELGWVPKEWEVRTVGEIADVTKLAGFEFTQYFQYVEDGEIIALRAMNIKNEKIDITKIQRVYKTVSDKLPRSKLHIGDIVFTYIGAYIGDAVIIDENDKYHLAPNICLIRPIQSNSAFFLFKQLRSEPLYRQMMSKTVTTATPSLTMTQIRTLKLNWPPINEQLEIETRLRSIDEKIDILAVDFKKKKVLKKGLMQDLLTGKVRVK